LGDGRCYGLTPPLLSTLEWDGARSTRNRMRERIISWSWPPPGPGGLPAAGAGCRGGFTFGLRASRWVFSRRRADEVPGLAVGGVKRRAARDANGPV